VNYEIVFAESRRSDQYVVNFVLQLPKITIATFNRYVGLLSQHGPNIGLPYSKKLDANLFELRIKGKIPVRIVYARHLRANIIVLLHGFIKKSDKIAQNDLKTARDRYIYWLRHY